MERDSEELSSEPVDSGAMEKLLEMANTPEDELRIEDNETNNPPEDAKPESPAEAPAETKPDQKEPERAGGTGPTDDKAPTEPGSDKRGAGDDDFSKEIEKIQLKTGASTKSQQALGILKDKAKREHIRAVEAEKQKAEITLEAADLKKRIESQELPPGIAKELEDHRTFRRAFDIEHDTEFTEKFVKAIDQEEENTFALLRRWDLKESAENYIKQNGGIAKFRVSEEVMPPKYVNEDGSRMTHAEWWEENIENKLGPAKREQLSDSITGIKERIRAKEVAIRDASGNRDRLLQEREEQKTKHAKEWSDRITAHVPKALEKYGPDIKLKEVKSDATPEQKAKVEKHNARITRANEIVKKYMSEITPESLVDSASEAAYAEIAREKITELESQLKAEKQRADELDSRINSIKTAGKTSHKNAAVVPKTQHIDSNKSAEEVMAAMMQEV